MAKRSLHASDEEKLHHATVDASVGAPADTMPLDTRPRSPLRQITGVSIVGTGSYVPSQVVSNDDLAELGCDADWIVQRTGIEQRRHLPSDLATSDMAAEASRRCLEKAGVGADQVDLLIVGTMTPDSPVPSAACVVQQSLGIRGPAFDVNAACAGFVYGLMIGMQFVRAGTSQCALIVGADTNSRICNPRDKRTYPLFGDGAGAVLLQPTDGPAGALAYTLGADGSGSSLLAVPGGGSRIPPSSESIDSGLHYIHMDGRAVFKWAVRVVTDTVRDVLEHCQLAIDDVDLVAFHQANVRIIEAAATDLGIPSDKLAVNLTRYGNTSAASVPLCLDEANRSGRLQPGDKVLLCGFGAGLAWGTALLQW